MPAAEVETAEVVDETPEGADQPQQNATFEIEDALNSETAHHPNTPRVSAVQKENLDESVLKTPETPEFLSKLFVTVLIINVINLIIKKKSLIKANIKATFF